MKVHSALAALLAAAWPLGAQTSVDLTRQGKVASGMQLPAQCARGQLFVKSDAPAGSNLYVCAQNDSWTAPLPYVGGVGVMVAGNSVEIENAVVPVYYTGEGAPSIGCAAGRDYYVDTAAGLLYYCSGGGAWRQVLDTTGNAATATALAAAPSQCAAGTYPLGIDARGNAQNCGAAGSGAVTHSAGGLTAGQLLIGNGAGDLKTGNLSGDCSTSGGAAITCAKTNGATFAPSATIDTTDAGNITSGTLPSARLPNPSPAALGGVQSKDCSGAGHVLKINTDGSVGCSPDSGGGGGGGAVSLTAGQGFLCISEPCQAQLQGAAAMTAGRAYYWQIVVPYTMTYKQFAAVWNGSPAQLVTALMDSSCNKIAGTDTRATYNGTGQYTVQSVTAAPPTIAPGVYYQAYGTDGASIQMSSHLYVKEFFYFGFYDGPGNGGSAPRHFYGSNSLTGSGATLAIPASCGTKTNVAVDYMPVAYIVP